MASALSASDLASRSALMFASFGCIWGVGLLLLALSSWRLSRRDGSWWTWTKGQAVGGKTSLSTVGVDPSVGQVPLPAQSSQGSLYPEESLVRLMWSVLPPFYRHRGATMRLPMVGWEVGVQWWRVVVTCHPYVRIARCLVRHGRQSLLGYGRSSSSSLSASQCTHGKEEKEEEETADEAREVVMDVVQALTSLTLACVMLALLYDFQYPEDDGFCATQTTQALCESRKMLLDPFHSQCLWHPDTTQTEQAAVIVESVGGVVKATVAVSASNDKTSTDCVFDDSSSSTLAFLVSYLITAAFANVLGLFLDRCVEVLHSQQATLSLSEKVVLTATVPSTLAEQPLSLVRSMDGHRKADRRWKEELAKRRFPHQLVQRLRRRRLATEMTAPEEGPSPASRARRRRVAVIGVTAVDEPMDGRHGPAMVVRPVEAVFDGVDGADGTAHSSAGDGSVNHAVTQALRSMSSTDYAVTMLRLAVADEVGRLGGPAERHVCLLGLYRAFPAVVTLRWLWLWQCAVVGVLLVCNGGALYYIVSKAAVRGYGWQVSFLKIALFEWFSEVVLLRGVEIALFDYGLCWLVEGEVEAAVARLEGVSLVSFAVPGADQVSSVSQEMARQWPTLPESRWVAGLWSLSSSEGAVGIDVGVGGRRRGRRRHRLKRLLSRGSLGVWEAVVSYGLPLVWALVVFLYSQYVQGWLASLSTLGRGLVAVVIVCGVSLVVAAWRIHQLRSSRSFRGDQRVEEDSLRHDEVGPADVEVGDHVQSSVAEVTPCLPFLPPTVVHEVEESAVVDSAVPDEADNMAANVTSLSSLLGSEDGSWHFSDSSRSSLRSSFSPSNSISFGSFDLNETTSLSE